MGPPSILLKPGDEPKVLATLPDELGELPAGWDREVRISYQTYQHIVSQRAKGPAWHVEFVLRSMAAVIAAPTHVGRLGGKPNRIELFACAIGDDCGVCVSIKCLHAETWVSTAFPLGTRSLQKHVGTGRLWSVEQHQGSLFNI